MIFFATKAPNKRTDSLSLLCNFCALCGSKKKIIRKPCKPNNMEPFWESIAEDIQHKSDYGDPKEWSEEKIKSFLADLEDQIIAKSKKDSRIAELCGAPFIKGRYAVEQLKTITPSTFRRIFQYGSSKGQTTTKHQFAVYFGYDSAEAYRNSKKLKFQVKTTKKKFKLKGQIGIGVGAVVILFLVLFGVFRLFSPSNHSKVKLNAPEITTHGDNSHVIIGNDVRVNDMEEMELLDSTKEEIQDADLLQDEN